jgi:hypothetical protein
MSSYDFASDNNPNKQKARELLGLLTSASLREVAENFEAYGINPRIKPDTSEVWDSLAADNLVAGNLNMAKQYFQKSLILNPNNQNAKRMLRKLK